MTDLTSPRARKIEIHLLRSTPPNRANSGQNSMNKVISVAGVPRDRLSSQSIKRPMRDPKSTPRTKSPHLVLQDGHLDPAVLEQPNAEAVLLDFVQAYYGRFDKKGRQQLPALVAVPHDEAARLARIFTSALPELLKLYTPGLWQNDPAESPDLEDPGTDPPAARPKAPKGVKKDLLDRYRHHLTTAKDRYTPGTDSDDVARFGRFVANLPDEYVQGAAYISHAIGTHRTRLAEETDFFTAFDDISGRTEHVGEAGLVAPLYYFFAAFDLGQYRRNRQVQQPDISEAELDAGVRRFVTDFIFAHPSGGEHGAYAHTLPEYALIVGRDDGYAISLANAYTDPVYPGGDGQYRTTLDLSIDRLQRQFEYTQTAFGVRNGLIHAASLSSQHTAANPMITAVGTLDSALDLALGR